MMRGKRFFSGGMAGGAALREGEIPACAGMTVDAPE